MVLQKFFYFRFKKQTHFAKKSSKPNAFPFKISSFLKNIYRSLNRLKKKDLQIPYLQISSAPNFSKNLLKTIRANGLVVKLFANFNNVKIKKKFNTNIFYNFYIQLFHFSFLDIERASSNVNLNSIEM